jgi:ATP-dependent exoDNAse (exonuclease V) alpha subunit
MAIYFMQINSVGRGSGRRATAAAAYRAGERIRDERTGEVHNYSERRDVRHAEIFLPRQFEGSATAWAHNRERLWNTAEHAEKHHNAKVAREYQVTLPHELTPEQRVSLARTFASEIAERYKTAVDLAIHDPRPDGDSRNFHAHLLATTREVTPNGLGAKVGLDLSARERRRRELPDHRHEYISLRERWAALTNEALQQANIAARVDHRSLAAQGLNAVPKPRIPLMHLKMEQRGIRSEVAERLRAEYRERVQRSTERAALKAASPAQTARTTMEQPGGGAPKRDVPTRDLEEVRRQAREAWLRLRPKEAERAAQIRGQETPREPAHGEEQADLPEPTGEGELGL